MNLWNPECGNAPDSPPQRYEIIDFTEDEVDPAAVEPSRETADLSGIVIPGPTPAKATAAAKAQTEPRFTHEDFGGHHNFNDTAEIKASAERYADAYAQYKKRHQNAAESVDRTGRNAGGAIMDAAIRMSRWLGVENTWAGSALSYAAVLPATFAETAVKATGQLAMTIPSLPMAFEQAGTALGEGAAMIWQGNAWRGVTEITDVIGLKTSLENLVGGARDVITGQDAAGGTERFFYGVSGLAGIVSMVAGVRTQFASKPPPTGPPPPGAGAGGKYYRYVGEGEAQVIRKTGRIPNVDMAGNPKKIYFSNRSYRTAGRAKTHNQLPNKPTYRVEIDPSDVTDRTPFTRVNPSDNPQWGAGGGVEATTRYSIPVDPGRITRLKGAPK
jgi:hypothetical protein